MADTGRGAVEAYLDVSPLQYWDRDRWDEYDLALDTTFHGNAPMFTPLANFVQMPNGADTWYTGSELLGAHVNHENIGLRQRFLDAMYVDMRRKKLTSNARKGGKIQLNEFDELVSRYGKGSPQLMLALLRGRLGSGVVQTFEKGTRDGIFEWSQFNWVGAAGAKFAVGTADFSDIAATSSYQANLKLVEDSRLRLSRRAYQYTQEFGTYAQPVPGYPGQVLAMTTPEVMFDLWNSEAGTWMQELRQTGDTRIMNGGVAQYRGITFQENPNAVLWNAGPITEQLAVTSPIRWGDGAPDPDAAGATGMVDNVYLVGQGSDEITHYIQLGAGPASIQEGDMITIHTQRTDDWGVTDGCDVFDGKSYNAIVYSVNAATHRIVLTEPMVEEYIDAFTATPSGGASTICYALVTKARDIHPLIIVAARGMVTWAARTPVRYHTPTDDEADLPSVFRYSWDQYTELNRWNPYVYEIYFFCATDTRSGRDVPALR